MSQQPFLILTLFLCSLMAPMAISPAMIATADEVVVCCDPETVDLHLLGSSSSGTLSPFSQKLADVSQMATISNAVTSEEEVGVWTLNSVWTGSYPSDVWTLSIPYEVSNAGGAQINASVTITAGSITIGEAFTSDSFLPPGEGTIDFDIDVDQGVLSNPIKVKLTARTIVFSVPAGDAKLELKWGSSDDDAILTATIPLLELKLLDPEIEGSNVYLPLIIDSPWGMETLAHSDSITLKVNGIEMTDDPIETAVGNAVRITWTWGDASGGIENINVEVIFNLQATGPTLSGSSTFEIETFDTGGGTGSYYPPDEPLRTNGDGSPLHITSNMELESVNGKLKLSRVTTIEVGGEMAFWMRWGMDHIGDDNPQLSPVLGHFNAGAVGEAERVSRFIEPVEVDEFERQLSSLATVYLASGMSIDAEELLGSFRDFETIGIELDLQGEDAVVNHPLTLKFSTTEYVEDGKGIDLIRSFIVVQPAPIWADYKLEVNGKTTATTSFSAATLRESKDLTFKHSRLPWGEVLSLEGDNIPQDEDFTLSINPTSSPVHSPAPLFILVVMTFLAGWWIALRMTAKRHRRWLYGETVLILIVAAIHYFAFPALFVAGSIAAVVIIWWFTAIISPRRLDIAEMDDPVIPTIPCPACSASNSVDSDERPFRFPCNGCGRVIKLVA
ncbi:MAG: hypothetical protein OSB30_03170 [Candidatus Poseidoniaceae archaeon]|nr:hypothetical protein [Candidatus Poseidoniaceae archaeon]